MVTKLKFTITVSSVGRQNGPQGLGPSQTPMDSSRPTTCLVCGVYFGLKLEIWFVLYSSDSFFQMRQGDGTHFVALLHCGLRCNYTSIQQPLITGKQRTVLGK